MPSMVAVRTNSIPRAASVSPVPRTAPNHISPGIATSMANATTRRLARPFAKSPHSGANTAKNQRGTHTARMREGTVGFVLVGLNVVFKPILKLLCHAGFSRRVLFDNSSDVHYCGPFITNTLAEGRSPKNEVFVGIQMGDSL